MEQLLIPVRRADAVLVFERRQPEAGRRAEFLAIAQITPDGTITPTGMGALSDAQAQAAAAAADKLPLLDRFVTAMSVHDLPSVQAALDAPADAGIVDNSVLMTLTLYLEFCRQSLVQEAAVRRYEARPLANRLDIGLSASIYESLLRTHELDRAEALIDEDLREVPAAIKRHPEAGYLLGLAATVKQRLGRAEGALELMETVSRLRPDAKLLVRMAHLYRAQGDRPKAISALKRSARISPLPYKAQLLLGHLLAKDEHFRKAADVFLAAEEQKPLEHGPARYLAWWLFNAGLYEKSAVWAGRAVARGSDDVEELFEELSKIKNSEGLA